jgi:imidazolonepropionase-like amidohydrolase
MSAARREGLGRSYVLADVHVLDESGSFTEATDVAVVDGVVTQVGRCRRDEGTIWHDCSGLWLMPGVVDCHVHTGFSTTDAMQALRTPITRWTLDTASNLAATLDAGVTFVRDAGGTDAGIRDAIRAGLARGPDLQVAIVVLSQTGGHMDGFLAGPGLELSAEYVLPDYPGRPPCVVDGTDGMRQTVRSVLRAGADWVKLCTTGGILSEHTDARAAEFSQEEIEVAVAEARRKGKSVMAHAFGGEGLDNAVRAGVRSIEHGVFLTEEQAALMAESGCWLVPTLAILREIVSWADDGTLPSFARRKADALRAVIGEAVAVAKDHGVPIALGTDYVSRDQHGRNLEEILFLHEAGLTAEEALLAATVRGAELCGVADRYGRIAPGFVFDAILLDEDPSDLRAFARPEVVTGVFKHGRPVRPHPRLAADASTYRAC